MVGLCRFRSTLRLSAFVAVLLAFATAAAARGFPGFTPEARDFQVIVQAIDLPDGTPADVYAPDIPRGLRSKFEDRFPIAVLLQGAYIDKSQYSRYSETIAAAGYVVVVPNVFRTIGFPPEVVSGYFASVNVITEAIDAMILEDTNPDSPLELVVDPSSVVLIGHSFGGAAVIDAAAGECEIPFCGCGLPFCSPPIADDFERPAGLKAAVIYGGSGVACEPDPPEAVADCDPLDRDTNGVAVALIQGTSDGIASPIKADATLPELEPPHALIQVPGVTHYAICDDAQPPGDATTEPNVSALEQEAAVELVARKTLEWLEMNLAAD